MNKFTTLSLISLISLMSALTLANVVMASSHPNIRSERLPFIRLYNPTINDHFYTSSQVEADGAVANHSYRIEGTMGYVERYQVDATEAIFRMWNPVAKKHFYTTNSNEVQSAQSSGFVLEGTVGFMQINPEQLANPLSGMFWQGEVIVYRLYNSTQRKHFYTVSQSEVNYLLTRGYASEGQLGGELFSTYDPGTQN